MTERQHRSLARYIRQAADVLGLRDWTVRLSPIPCEDPDHAATVSSVYERRIAEVQVASNFVEMDAAEQRHIIAHELTHIHMDAPLFYLVELLPKIVGQSAWTPLEATLRLLHEQGIDGLAASIEYRLPLWAA